jgi:tetratricopeptide (TPR) repeat protein
MRTAESTGTVQREAPAGAQPVADGARTWNRRGLAQRERKEFDAALASFDEALRLDEGHVEAHVNRGNVLRVLKRFDEALASLDRAVALDPRNATAFNGRGVALYEMKRFAEAIASFDRAIEIDPKYAAVFNNIGISLIETGRRGAALACFDKATALKPGYGEALNNRGTLLHGMLRLGEARASFDAALAAQPGYVEARWNKSLCLLLGGDLQQGWPLYEARWEREEGRKYRRDFPHPLWLGDAPLKGRTILLHAEQGLGDTLQFIRYATMVAALGANVAIEAQASLVPLLRSSQLPGVLVERREPLPPFELHCPLVSLPLAFGTTLQTIPRPAAYLRSEGRKVADWSARLGPRTRPRVGLVFSGSTTHRNDRNRSITLAQWLPHLPATCDYVSLQKEVREADAAVLQTAARIRRFESDIRDFSDTAALCELMDVVVSVDTSVAHLAAALGRPTWILLPHAPDWRWLLDREDSPWYPSARLYRQQSDGEWQPVLARIARDLQAIAN